MHVMPPIMPFNKRKPRILTDEEKQLWDFVTRGDAPLSGRETADGGLWKDVERKPFVARHAISSLPSPVCRSPLSELPLATGAYAGIDRNTAERFRKGEMMIDGMLDLHGMIRNQAHRALCVFLKSHHERGSRCVLVITGKGMPKDMWPEPSRGILREMLPEWLGEPGLKTMVLAFDVAKQKHGGSGAYYILLRRRR